MQTRLLLLLFLLQTGFLIAQQDNLAIGQWRSHLPYRNGAYVTQSNDQVFYATEWSILVLDKADFAVDFVSTVKGPNNANKGLSDTGINLIKYHQPSNTLIVIYQNSVIDLIRNDTVTTLNQIANFTNFVGAKTIYDVVPEDDESVFLAANYGLSKLNLIDKEFTYTTFTEGLDVRAIANFNGFLHMGTEEGIYRTPVDNFIPEDFRTWDLMQVLDSTIYSTNTIAVFNEHLVFNIDADLYKMDQNGNLEFLTNQANQTLKYLTAEGPNLLAGFRCNDCDRGKLLVFNTNFVFTDVNAAGCIDQVQYGIQEPSGRIFLADNFRFFRVINDFRAGDCNRIEFNSPATHKLREIAIANDQVWVTSGGLNQSFSNTFSGNGFFRLEEGQWTNFNNSNNVAIAGKDGTSGGNDDLLDFVTAAINPLNGNVYLGSFYEGLVEYDGENFNLFNEDNSTLSAAIGDGLRTRVSGLAFDEENNLWVANHAAVSPLSVLTNEGNWVSFRPSCGRTEIHQIAIDDLGNKWIVDATTGAGVIVFNEGDLADPNDDQCRVVTQNNSELETNRTNCVAADLDGVIWVGTTEGITIFNCGEDALTDCQGNRPFFALEGESFGEFLLEREEVQTIAVDGANRKWVGTKNGVFVLSPDGGEELMRFTTTNSPLFDNNVLDIAINQKNGEVFIGTDKGLISYKSDAIQGGRVNRADLKVYPNPVAPSYEGPIAIEGLARDANVKITNITGDLVFETTALGGQAVWDGRDYNGRRVNTGVYLIFSTQKVSSFDTFQPDAAVAKLVFIR